MLEKMEENVIIELDKIKNNINDIDYSKFYVGIEDYELLVRIGRTRKERLQILILCYVYRPTLNELNNWELNDLIKYMEETDEFFEEDMIYIRKCEKIINELGDE